MKECLITLLLSFLMQTLFFDMLRHMPVYMQPPLQRKLLSTRNAGKEVKRVNGHEAGMLYKIQAYNLYYKNIFI